ncbi:rpl6B (nucleomorph) [Hemiselmis andersenii]|uniref:Rpl6B n=1 Tax=Hemiselmis andersenii TaxID=464988 RepID=A9BLD7_HEMAN|nr:rpl6B [Hemiselmis andersenii]ABW98320.1 rpl6B [Hemiselmis andersenii]|mmetsp:Transcript_12304/g.28805  ORF Transcript_12304/g.28805 Transcript_12304/m.28805 type:complete len:202 (+) Transcript_12304:78-683(+)
MLKQKLTEKKNFWANSAIQKINLTNKKLTQLINFKKLSPRSHLSQNLFQKSSSLREKRTKTLKNKRLIIKTKKKFKIGSIIILLGSKFQGKKAVLLKITKKGLLIISGPFSVNGISLRRINPRYAVPTEIGIGLNNLQLGFLNDDYFNLLKNSNRLSSNYQKLKLISFHRVRQSVIDEKLKKKILKNFFLKFYMKSKTKRF